MFLTWFVFLLQAEGLQEETQWEPGASFAKSVHMPSLAPVSGVDLFQQTMVLTQFMGQPSWAFLAEWTMIIVSKKNAEEEKSSLNHYDKSPSSLSLLMLWKTFNLLHAIGYFTEEMSIGCCAIWGMWMSFYFWQIQTQKTKSPFRDFPCLMEKAVYLQRPIWEITNGLSLPHKAEMEEN